MTAKKLKFAVDRANAGTAFDIAEKFFDEVVTGGQTWTEFASQEIADRAIDRYSVHIRAALARAGVVLEDGERLDSYTLLRIIQDKTGLEIESLTPDAVATAVQGRVSAKLSDSLGVEVQDFSNADELKTLLIAAAKAAVTSGRANALITKSLIKKIRAIKAWQESGIDPTERQKLLQRSYQKNYRRTHKQVWYE